MVLRETVRLLAGKERWWLYEYYDIDEFHRFQGSVHSWIEEIYEANLQRILDETKH